AELAAILGALKILGVRDWRCFAVAFLWVATLQAVATGTFSALLVLVLALAWRYRDRRRIVALSVAYAVGAKLFVWPLFVWLLATRRFATAAATFAATLLLVFGTWAVIGL